jgi:nitrogen fixation NifU-like protein
MYAPTFLDHVARPRSQGRLESATHRAEAEDHACGDRLALDLEVASGRVVAARFRVQGCPGAIAAGSALASLLPGRAAGPAAVTAVEIEAALGAVPPAKRHALALAADVLARAFGGGGRLGP